MMNDFTLRDISDAATLICRFSVETVRLRAENANLRDAIRLLIGRQNGMPWNEVSQSDVDSYLAEIARLKENHVTI